MYAIVAMGGVFGAAAQAPLTAIASVVEMTGNFTLTVPVMLATGIAPALSKHLSYGSIYTTKLLRRGIDIERPREGGVLQTMTVADVMQRRSDDNGRGQALPSAQAQMHGTSGGEEPFSEVIGPVADVRQPQALFADETLEQALRQLTLYGHSGLPWSRTTASGCSVGSPARTCSARSPGGSVPRLARSSRARSPASTRAIMPRLALIRPAARLTATKLSRS